MKDGLSKHGYTSRLGRKLFLICTATVIIIALYLTCFFDFNNPKIAYDKLAEEDLSRKLNYTSNLKQYFRQPKCANILETLTKGQWSRARLYNYDLELEISKFHLEYRAKNGIPTQLWRKDDKCGYNVLVNQANPKWRRTGTFCNPKGPKPCCSNLYKGECTSITSSMKCDCPTCVDTSKYNDALLSEWITHDKSCDWHIYNEIESCAVLNNLSKGNLTAKLYIVGDSLMRNMFMGLTAILTGNTKRGIYRKSVSKELRNLCWGENLFILNSCRFSAMSESLDQLNSSAGELCKGQRNFNAEHLTYGMPHLAKNFLNFVHSIQGKENYFVVLGVGLHFQCKANDVIKKFLEPIFASRKRQLDAPVWPQFLWVQPTSPGLLKPPEYLPTQGDEAIQKFADDIASYLKEYNVPILDFRHITKGVYSFDGTHYGTGVNMMKVQILLNYLATL